MKINSRKIMLIIGILVAVTVLLNFCAINLFQREMVFRGTTSADLSKKDSIAQFAFESKLNHISMIEFYSKKNYIITNEDDSSIEIRLICSTTQEEIKKTVTLKSIAIMGRQTVKFDQTLDCKGQKVSGIFRQMGELPEKSITIILETTQTYTNGYPRVGYKIYLKDIAKEFTTSFFRDKPFAYSYISLLAILSLSLTFLIIVEPIKKEDRSDG